MPSYGGFCLNEFTNEDTAFCPAQSTGTEAAGALAVSTSSLKGTESTDPRPSFRPTCPPSCFQPARDRILQTRDQPSTRLNRALRLFLQMKFHRNTTAPTHPCTVEGCFHTTTAEVRSCGRDRWPAKPKSSTVWPLTGKPAKPYYRP